jgi:hypothetical protein
VSGWIAELKSRNKVPAKAPPPDATKPEAPPPDATKPEAPSAPQGG